MTTPPTPAGESELLQAIMNLARYHRQHEQFYASSPRELAVSLQRQARALHALADQWESTEPSVRAPFSPYEGTEDLNSPVATQLTGVLFMEGEGRPAELTNLIRDVRAAAADSRGTAEWLATAMQASWDIAVSLIGIDGLADLLGERHRVIANDWLAAHMNAVIGRTLDRAADILESVDFTPSALRAELGDRNASVGRLRSAAELLAHAADLCSDSAGLVNDNERRWRVFRQRVSELTAPGAADGA